AISEVGAARHGREAREGERDGDRARARRGSHHSSSLAPSTATKGSPVMTPRRRKSAEYTISSALRRFVTFWRSANTRTRAEAPIGKVRSTRRSSCQKDGTRIVFWS